MFTKDDLQKNNADRMKRYQNLKERYDMTKEAFISKQTKKQQNNNHVFDDSLLELFYNEGHNALIHMQKDAEKETRLKQHKCQYCFYKLPGVGGSAFTSSYCQNCGISMTFPSTLIDKLCSTCAEKLHACKECGASINMAINH